MIGICTRYRKCDSTIAALAIAKHFDRIGRRYKLLPDDWRVPIVDKGFDNKVLRQSYSNWLKGLKHIIWTMPADNQFIELAHEQGIKSTLYTSWDQLEPFDEAVLDSFSQVLMPSIVQAMQLRTKFKLKSIGVLPYYCDMPITKKKGNLDNIKIFISLYGNQVKRVELQALTMLAQILNDNSKTTLTIATSKGLAPYTIKDLKALSKKFTSRLRIIDCLWHEHVIEMGNHDLTIWPCKFDGMGLVGISSLYMGTPVIAWDINPVNEYLSPGRNSLLVSCNVEYDWIGMPRAVTDYNEFSRILRWLLDRPDALIELRKHTAERIEEMRTDFKKGLQAILPAMM